MSFASSTGRGRLPAVVFVLALCTFVLGTSEFVVAGLLPEIATDIGVSIAQAGPIITVFAAGMVVGAPVLVVLMLRMPRRLTLVLALLVFSASHLLAAFTFVAPLLTDRAGMDAGLLPVVLVVFGVGSLIGVILGGRLGDAHPYRTTILAASSALTGMALESPLGLQGPPVVGAFFGVLTVAPLVALAVTARRRRVIEELVPATAAVTTR